MVGERIMWAMVLYAAGFASAVIVGAKNGEQMTAGVADVLDCDEMARADRVDCLQRVEVMAQAINALGDHCVLSLPPGNNIRVARMPREVMP